MDNSFLKPAMKSLKKAVDATKTGRDALMEDIRENGLHLPEPFPTDDGKEGVVNDET